MPTAARQKYLAKQAAKQADRFTDADRQGEYDKVFSQLGQISDPEVDKFEALMSEWVKDGNVRQGVIPVPSIRRAIVYSLGISRSKTFVSLRSDEPEKYNNATTNSENTEASTSTTNITHQQNINTTIATDGVYEDAVEEIPNLVPVVTPETETPSDTILIPPAEQTNASVVNTSNQSKNAKAKKKKQQVFTQPAPRGSRHASRPPAMKPKAQSA